MFAGSIFYCWPACLRCSVNASNRSANLGNLNISKEIYGLNKKPKIYFDHMYMEWHAGKYEVRCMICHVLFG